MRRAQVILLVLFKTLLASFHAAHAETADYLIGAPVISIPDGHAGETIRSIMQFRQWTLICDSDRKENTKTCNATQAIFNSKNQLLFSWSLVSSENGRLVFIMRTSSDADTSSPILLKIEGRAEPVRFHYEGCDSNICLAQNIVGPILSNSILDSSNVMIEVNQNNEKQVFNSSFSGLLEALEYLKSIQY